MGVILLLQDEMKPQCFVLWVQLLQVEDSWKYNIHKKVKPFFNIHVSNKFDILFYFCLWMNRCIFDKVNSKGSS